MRNPEQIRPTESWKGRERSDDAVRMSLERLEKQAGEAPASKTDEQMHAEMAGRLETLNHEIPALAEELNIIEEAMGAVEVRNDVRGISHMTENVADVIEPDAPAPRLTPEEFGKLEEARTALTDKIQRLQWERHTMEQVLHPDDYQELERARGELGMTQRSMRTFRHQGGMVGAYPEKPTAPIEMPPTPKKPGIIAKLKGFFK